MTLVVGSIADGFTGLWTPCLPVEQVADCLLEQVGLT
jgi:hypothetical protein